MAQFVERMLPFEVRIEGVEDNHTSRHRVQDLIINGGGIARYIVVPAKSNGKPSGLVTIFVAMRRACYAEDNHSVFQPNPLPIGENETNEPSIILSPLNPNLSNAPNLLEKDRDDQAYRTDKQKQFYLNLK
ncbi:unnamed protein product [Brachionus calyciflorus]|uniref:Uncharacterized protein n=1 Tax=Brachionus calyciflorus TaxID=104777 RepID=A0A814DPU4_9BILA|nr:unnamed protein product [Brachionus calyciflorus]